jgi:hypothetical protein
MAAAIVLRDDYESAQLLELARQSEDADQLRRLLALALVHDGGSRSAGARAGGVGLQKFRDWVLWFNAKGPSGLMDGKAPGQVPRIDRAERRELAQLVEDGPILGVRGVVRGRLRPEPRCAAFDSMPEAHLASRACRQSCATIAGTPM